MTAAEASSRSGGMWPYHPDLLAVPVPRYTSYPTAAEFSDKVGAEEAEAALRAVSGDISLYFHIPFCEQICWYCGCNTGASNRRQRLESYLDALHREIALTGARLGNGVKVRRVALGGGSPNAITLVGLGASAISGTPGLLWQNEKNAGRYRMLLSQDRLPAVLGVIRSGQDRLRGIAIEDLLCHGITRLDVDLACEIAPRLAPFADRGLVRIEGGTLRILPEGLAYSRTIAALLDPYRADSQRKFSSAV